MGLSNSFESYETPDIKRNRSKSNIHEERMNATNKKYTEKCEGITIRGKRFGMEGNRTRGKDKK